MTLLPQLSDSFWRSLTSARINPFYSDPLLAACGWQTTIRFVAAAARRFCARSLAARLQGAACDIPSHLYSFSWAPNPFWSREWVGRDELLAYVERVALGLRSRGVAIRCGATLERAEWRAAERAYTLHLADGETLRADYLVSAVGQLSEPRWPRIAGLDDALARPVWHTAEWRDDVPLAGRTVAVIGAGASSLQLVPELAKTCKVSRA